MILLISLLAIYYVLLMLALTVGVFLLPKRKENSSQQGISVVVAARNEEDNIRALLNCLNSQHYPPDKFEVIVVSDRSTDATEEMVSKHKAKNVQLLIINPEEQGGKKRALTKGIEKARFDILAFTDADCLPSPEWLSELNNHFTAETDFVAGYSPLSAKKNNLLLKLKNLERTSIFAVSAGSIGLHYGLTCTGRNIAYRQELFHNTGGFTGIEDIPSGDDDLLLQMMNPFSRKMTFMFSPGSVVQSVDIKNARQQLDQETRRASKWKYYPLPVKIITALVFLFYLVLTWWFVRLLMMPLGFFSPPTASLPGTQELLLFLLVIGCKVLSEIVLLAVFCIKLKIVGQLIYLPLAELIYLPYFLFFAIKGSLGKYSWKG